MIDDPEQIEQGRKAFAGPCEFIGAVNNLDALPPATLPEMSMPPSGVRDTYASD